MREMLKANIIHGDGVVPYPGGPETTAVATGLSMWPLGFLQSQSQGPITFLSILASSNRAHHLLVTLYFAVVDIAQVILPTCIKLCGRQHATTANKQIPNIYHTNIF